MKYLFPVVARLFLLPQLIILFSGGVFFLYYGSSFSGLGKIACFLLGLLALFFSYHLAILVKYRNYRAKIDAGNLIVEHYRTTKTVPVKGLRVKHNPYLLYKTVYDQHNNCLFVTEDNYKYGAKIANEISEKNKIGSK